LQRISYSVNLMVNCCPFLCIPGGCSWRSMRCCQPSRSAAALITSRATITTAREPQEPDSRPPTGCCPPRQSLVRGRCGPIARPAASVINTTSPRLHERLPCPCPVLPCLPACLPASQSPSCSHDAANPASQALGRIRLGPFASCGPNTVLLPSLHAITSLLSLSLHPSLHRPSLFLSLSSRLHPLSLE
jgi:hypothetical protein